MPRKSAAARVFPILPGTSQRLRPPRELDVSERKIFVDLVAASKPDAFRASDLPLLCTFCRSIALERRSAAALAAGDAKALAMRLRLSPQSRAPNNPSRPQPQPQQATSYYDRAQLEADE
jgi:hypothetical protein